MKFHVKLSISESPLTTIGTFMLTNKFINEEHASGETDRCHNLSMSYKGRSGNNTLFTMRI